MSTKKSSYSKKDDPKRPYEGSEAKKVQKSAGFIETSDFKPNWLETGPLSPEMLPESEPNENSQLSPNEYETLQASLQRFYQQEATDDPVDAMPEVIAEPIEGAEETAISESDSVEIPAIAAPEIIAPEIIASEIITPEIVAAEVTIPEFEGIQVDAPTPDETIESESIVPENPIEETLIEEVLSTPPEAWVQALLDGADPELVAASEPALSRIDPLDTSGEETTTDDFIEEEPEVMDIIPVATSEAMPEATPDATEKPKHKRNSTPSVKKRRDKLSMALIIASLLLLAVAAVIYWVNPFSRLALGSSSLARPVASPSIPLPRTGSGNWCIQGDFLEESAAPPRLVDSGNDGDILAEDSVFSLEYAIAQPGTFEWQVVDCENAALRYPQAPAWITTTSSNQPVTFTFDSNERADPLFFPIPYVVSATDATADYSITGSFQDWNPDDATGKLQQINSGLYQQVRRIARPGEYEAYVISGGENQAIDAYGRSIDPIPFSFQTDRNGDYVVFLVDTDRGRASVMYDMSPVLTSLAFGNGYRLLSMALAGLAFVLLFGLFLRLLIVRNRRLQMEAGCPNCGQQELMRIARRPGDRFLHLFGIPAYRYRCRHCTWEGTRLSAEGAAVSPGVALAHINEK